MYQLLASVAKQAYADHSSPMLVMQHVHAPLQLLQPACLLFCNVLLLFNAA
jgi:hypothetical protein